MKIEKIDLYNSPQWFDGMLSRLPEPIITYKNSKYNNWIKLTDWVKVDEEQGSIISLDITVDNIKIEDMYIQILSPDMQSAVYSKYIQEKEKIEEYEVTGQHRFFQNGKEVKITQMEQS